MQKLDQRKHACLACGQLVGRDYIYCPVCRTETNWNKEHEMRRLALDLESNCVEAPLAKARKRKVEAK